MTKTDKPSAAARAQQQLRDTYASLEKEVAAVDAQTAPLRAERDEITAKIQPYEDKARELAKEYMRIEAEAGLFDMKMQLGALAKVLGGKSLTSVADTGESQ